MKDLSNKIYYLQGYCEALDLSSESKEGNVLKLIIDILGEMNEKIEELENNHDEVVEFIESLSEENDSISKLLEDNCENILSSNEDLELDCPICKTVFTVKERELYTEEDVTCPECNTVVLSEETESSFEKICEEIYDKLFDENNFKDEK